MTCPCRVSDSLARWRVPIQRPCFLWLAISYLSGGVSFCHRLPDFGLIALNHGSQRTPQITPFLGLACLSSDAVLCKLFDCFDNSTLRRHNLAAGDPHIALTLDTRNGKELDDHPDYQHGLTGITPNERLLKP